LFGYVMGNPISFIDPRGLDGYNPEIAGERCDDDPNPIVCQIDEYASGLIDDAKGVFATGYVAAGAMYAGMLGVIGVVELAEAGAGAGTAGAVCRAAPKAADPLTAECTRRASVQAGLDAAAGLDATAIATNSFDVFAECMASKGARGFPGGGGTGGGTPPLQ
jgi:hypothetical protein